jgi:hypothetical protein
LARGPAPLQVAARGRVRERSRGLHVTTTNGRPRGPPATVVRLAPRRGERRLVDVTGGYVILLARSPAVLALARPVASTGMLIFNG